MGIGQPNFAAYRYRIVDYLPAMYMFEYIMSSKKPREIASYDAIIYPFDSHTWVFTTCSILAEFLVFIFAQNLWSFMNGNTNPGDYIVEGHLITRRR